MTLALTCFFSFIGFLVSSTIPWLVVWFSSIIIKRRECGETPSFFLAISTIVILAVLGTMKMAMFALDEGVSFRFSSYFLGIALIVAGGSFLILSINAIYLAFWKRDEIKY